MKMEEKYAQKRNSIQIHSITQYGQTGKKTPNQNKERKFNKKTYYYRCVYMMTRASRLTSELKNI